MISIVIPIYISSPSGYAMTERCLKSAETDIEHELIIVETETDYFKDHCDIHIYEKNRTNATKSINRGFRVASGDKVVLLTNDVVLEQNWLKCLLDCFDKEDCGLATLATSQLGHKKEDKIEEGIWFSVAMMPRMDNYFDEGYVNSWDDSDLIMRTYLSGNKMYRNFNSIVEHEPGKTMYKQKDHSKNFCNNRDYFKNKYKDCKDHRMYKILTEGWVI